MGSTRRRGHIRLLTHPRSHSVRPPAVHWGKADPVERGPLIGTLNDPEQRNVIGTHGGSYAFYRALAVASGALDPGHQADLTDTRPTGQIGPHPSWGQPDRIVSIDPFGHLVSEVFSESLAAGMPIQPTIAVTRAHLDLPEIKSAIAAGRLKPDGHVLTEQGTCLVTKAAIEPVWHLPGVARRFGIDEAELRHTLFEETGGAFPELVTRGDLEVFLPPIGGMTVYVFGELGKVHDPAVPLTARVHDECNGSDVFGSDICTCRPYLTHAVEECVASAQAGGTGVIVYFRKEGRALGEVTKFLVYNARKRQEGGDSAAAYFARTECVAGVQDVRFQELMPDVLHWLGIRRIARFISMSNMKHDAIVASGIEIAQRVPIPDALIPEDAQVEIEAKRAAGYYTEGSVPPPEALARIKGRGLAE